jgi:hypothetical protein
MSTIQADKSLNFQLPINTNFWTSHDSTLHSKHIRSQKISCVELSKHSNCMISPEPLRNVADPLSQCAIPVVEGLLPEEHNREILGLLFTLAEWHSFAKLKLHTDSTIGLFRKSTKEVGRLLRRFQRVVCPKFDTKELDSEQAARGRRQAKKASQGGKGKAPVRGQGAKPSANTKEFSLLTYKLHSLGDYIATILWFGTSDSYSTQPVSLLLIQTHRNA